LSIYPFLCKLLNKNEAPIINKDQFSKWLTGFIDAEGNFKIFIYRTYLRIMFRIRLHKDDISTLYKIHSFLGLGKVSIDKDSSLFIINNVNDLLNILFPLLDKYSLYTTKWLDYNDLKNVAIYLSKSNTSKIPDLKLEEIRNIYNNMNLGRVAYNYYLIPKFTVDPFWLLGFNEGEGTFSFKKFSPYFQARSEGNILKFHLY
jgi:hypothetical protein